MHVMSYIKYNSALFTGYQNMKKIVQMKWIDSKKVDESRPYRKMKNRTHVDNFR